MTTEHTAEPWQVGKLSRIETVPNNLGGRTVIVDESAIGVPANARRIVACINACAGVSTDDLYETMLVERCDDLRKAEELSELSSRSHSLKRDQWEMLCAEQRQRAAMAERQRDALAEALRDMVHFDDLSESDQVVAMTKARAALAKLS